MSLSIARPALFAPLLMFAFSMASAGQVSMSITTNGDQQLESCEDIQVRINNRDAARDEDRLSLRDLKGPLHISMPESGGVQIQGTDSRELSVLACKAVAARPEEKTRQLLDGISVRLTDGSLQVSGPKSEGWVVYLLVKAPKDATLDVETGNGEIRLVDLRGQVEARTENGPISVKHCAGTLHAKSENGPISFSGSSGDLRLTSINGPISVEPSGSRWTGGRLVARTENGPVAIKLSEDFQSSFEVEASNHAPMSCSAVQCEKARKTWDDDHRRVSFGSAEPALKASTENGPISVESSKGEDI
jgi:DUF4097 and DUF4098 domain-containing protein YvlB